MTLLAALVEASESVRATRSRSKKTALLAEFLSHLTPDEAPAAVSFLSGKPLQKRLGAGYAAVYSVEAAPAREAGLSILDVHAALDRLGSISGPGSQARRANLLAELFASATLQEQEFLRGLIVRNLRQGALEGVMADAVAEALDVDANLVRRAAMLEGDLIAVATAALVEGPEALANAQLEVFTPIQPMLAKSATSAAEAVAAMTEAAVEAKLDGLRVQVHRHGETVRIYTRNLNDITARAPELVAETLALDVRSVILDGEALMLAPDGSPLDFQDSMARAGTEAGVEGMPLTAFFFDILHVDGIDLLDEPLKERRRVLSERLPRASVVDSIETRDPQEAEAFFTKMVEALQEGVVVKDLATPYEAGRRGSGWVKVKPVHTLDLVVLAAEWGSGRREGWLSNLHLGARDGSDYVMLGKTFKGLTDEMLEWQTERFLEIESHRERHVVHLRPEIVYEIAFDGVQRSSRYPGGVALRFARVKRYREDKSPANADTLESVRGFLRT